MSPDDRLVHRLLDELKETNRRLDDLAPKLEQVKANVNRLDNVEELANRLQRRVEGEEGLNTKMAILFQSARRWDAAADVVGTPAADKRADTNRKALIAGAFSVAVAFIMVIGHFVIEAFKALFNRI